MWLFTPRGFASVVKNQRPEGGFLVRFRSRIDAENFVADSFTRHSHAGGEIFENPKADYMWRVVVPQNVLTNYLLDTVDVLNYPNFKNEVHTRTDQENKTRAYTDVWCAMHAVQADEIRRRDPNWDRQPGHGGKLPLWADLDLVRACPSCGKEREFQSTAPKAAEFTYKCTGCNTRHKLREWHQPAQREIMHVLPGQRQHPMTDHDGFFIDDKEHIEPPAIFPGHLPIVPIRMADPVIIKNPKRRPR